MTNVEKYNSIFTTTFSIPETELGEQLVYQTIPAWDSIGHMTLIAALEEAFDIMLDAEDIIDFSNYCKGKEILGKYDVKV